MQFIVKPNTTSPWLVLKKFFRFHSTTVLVTIGGLVLFSTGFMFGLLWNMDSACSKTISKHGDDSGGLEEADDIAQGLAKEFTDIGGSGNSGLIHHSMSPADRQKTNLFVIIMSAPGYKDRRDAIRETWIKLIGDRSVRYYFSIGSHFGGKLMVEHLRKEQEEFKDMMIFPHIEDSYSTLSQKLLESLKWSYSRFNYKFVLKADDDSFVRIDKLYDELMSKKSDMNNLYWGYFDGDAHVKRQGKWSEENWFLCDKYLPYALGGGYIISSHLVRYIVANAHYLNLYHNEDVNMGVWLAPLNITRLHDPRFDTEYKSRGCSNNFLITHKQDLNQMKEKYDNLNELGVLCKSQVIHRKAYFYNWKVAPSSCCFRNISLL